MSVGLPAGSLKPFLESGIDAKDGDLDAADDARPRNAAEKQADAGGEMGAATAGEDVAAVEGAEDAEARAQLSRVLGEGDRLMASLGEEKSGEVLRGEFKGYATGGEAVDSKVGAGNNSDVVQGAAGLSTPAPKPAVDAGYEDRRSESAKKLARLVEEGDTLVAAIPEESAAALLEALQEGEILQVHTGGLIHTFAYPEPSNQAHTPSSHTR